MTSLGNVIETLIKEAQARGEFDDLPGKGKSIDLTDYFNMPEEVRVAQSMLKSAGMVPVEVELLQEMAALKENLATTNLESERDNIRKLIKEKQLQFNLLAERRKRQFK
jgi:hypothetical protein